MTEPVHHVTIDVEEYFHVSALERFVPRSRWSTMESRLAAGMDRILEILDAFETRGTFFILGVVARDHPEMVRSLARAGHEVASHGWDHRRVTTLDPAEFRRQVRDTRALLEELSGEQVLGFRAPSFSIVPGKEWALEILVEEGYVYDSSLYPVRRPGYGYPRGARTMTTLETAAGPLVEVPPATLRVVGTNLPLGGGGSLRHLPLGLTRAALSAFRRGGQEATLYLHPWEFDPDQPRIPGIDWLTRLRHYGGLQHTEPRLRQLMEEFRFGPIRDSLQGEFALLNQETP